MSIVIVLGLYSIDLELSAPMRDRLLNWLNTALVINVFFVLLSFGWFVVGILGRSFNVNLGFDLWLSLWDPVFTPSIGILMGGAILSGILSWVNRRFFTQDS